MHRSPRRTWCLDAPLLLVALVLALAPAAGRTASAQLASAAPPNVVIIFANGLG